MVQVKYITQALQLTMKTFAQRLRELREEHDLTQEQLATALGFKTYTVISNWEGGKRRPDIDNLKVIAKYFNVSVDYLVGMTDIKTAY